MFKRCVPAWFGQHKQPSAPQRVRSARKTRQIASKMLASSAVSRCRPLSRGVNRSRVPVVRAQAVPLSMNGEARIKVGVERPRGTPAAAAAKSNSRALARPLEAHLAPLHAISIHLGVIQSHFPAIRAAEATRRLYRPAHLTAPSTAASQRTIDLRPNQPHNRSSASAAPAATRSTA
jgi:hypothetical protein